MKIAVGNSRMDKKWKNQDISWVDLCARCGSTIRTTETVEEYRKLKKGQQDGIKDVGGFVGGHLREGRRKNGMVLCRSLLTLDMDYGTPDIWDEITLFHDFKCCVYSTHKHTPVHPRLRLLIPLKREISEEEYMACGDPQVGSSSWADLLGGGRHGNRAQGGTPAAGQRIHHQPGECPVAH